MKLYIVTILIISFMGVAALGAMFMMPHGDHGEEVACIASLAKGNMCPKGDVFASLAFHVSAFKNFSTAVFAGSSLIFLLASIALLIFTSIAIFRLLAVPKTVLNFNTRYRYLFDFISIPPKQEFLRWFSLHENSPTTA